MSMFKSFANATVTSLETVATTVQCANQMVTNLGAAGVDQTKRLQVASRSSLIRTQEQSLMDASNLVTWREQELKRITLANEAEDAKLKQLQEQLGVSDEKLADGVAKLKAEIEKLRNENK